MAPDEKSRESTMSYPYQRNNANTTRKPAVQFNPFKTVFIDRKIDGKERIALLEAPPIARKAQWKLRSFLHCEKKLRPKLKTYAAAALISVFGEHFDFTTHVANDQAEVYVEEFKKAFGNVQCLAPHAYYDKDGKNVTASVRDKRRPPNFAYVLIEANLPLMNLHATFTNSDMFTHQYFLRLPQSYNSVLPPRPSKLRLPPAPSYAIDNAEEYVDAVDGGEKLAHDPTIER